MAESISRQVSDFLKENPSVTNAELYARFPKVRENTLRNYKSKFRNSNHKGGSKRLSARKKPSQLPNSATVSSLRGRVFEFFKQNPGASNQKLYEEFANYSKNKLRHYKASFFKTAQTTNTGNRKPPRKSKRSMSKTEASIANLNQRLQKLEEQVQSLSNQLEPKQKPSSFVKSTLSEKASSAEKRIQELEETLMEFLTEKRKKIKSEISNLDEIQQAVSEKLNSFLKSFKDR